MYYTREVEVHVIFKNYWLRYLFSCKELIQNIMLTPSGEGSPPVVIDETDDGK